MSVVQARRVKAIQNRLLDWFAVAGRDLPWRRRPSPYRTWVSEIMAQQTRIRAVEPYFNRFMRKFPSLSALARASVDEVLAEWSGLGYYSRARNLHQAAGRVVHHYGGKLPKDPTELEKLPGIGPYTAGAIASIAFSCPVPVVDGNVVRVLSRLFDLDQAAGKDLTQLAAKLVPAQNAGVYNESLMELGALVCTPSSPACPACPLKRLCWAKRAGTIHLRPARTKKKAPKIVRLLAAVLRRPDGKILLIRQAYQGLFGGMWLPPSVSLPPKAGLGKKEALRRELASLLGRPVTIAQSRGRIEHVLTHLLLKVESYDCSLGGSGRIPKKNSWRWIANQQDLQNLGVPALTRKILANHLSDHSC